jgi:serine/threonine protein kinase
MPDLVRTVGRYGIVSELGRGGMAVVYLARQVDLDRLVALKELAAFHAADPSFAQRFVRESRLAGSIVHPNVITVFDYFEHEGTPYIAMEYVERGSLRPYVGKMTLAQIGGVLEGLLAGLAEAEQHAIVHRDLKPENLMVTAAGSVKIADFGIAKATQVADTGAFVTATGTTVGTPPYMAPEQAMGKGKEVGPWTDLYSVGCMAYELFTGRPPFYDAEEPLAILLRHITEPLPPASEVGVDPEISAWIEHLTAKDAKARPESATAAWEELEEILIGQLGPRWRREARLPEPPRHVPGPATPPPSAPMSTPPGIDMAGTGPDTPLPTAPEAEPEYETYHTPPSGPPRIEAEEPVEAAPPQAAPPAPEPPVEAAPPAPTPTPPPDPPPPVIPLRPVPPLPPEPVPEPEPLPPAAELPDTYLGPPAEPVAPRVGRLARAGAIALVASVLIPLVAEGADRWNVFAVLSPIEAVGVAVAVWVVAGRAPTEAAAGALLGFGVLTTVAGLALIRFAANRLDAIETLLAVVALGGAIAVLTAGVRCLRSAERGPPAAGADPAPLVLGLAGVALACVALIVDYDGFSSLWDELKEGESAEFFVEPAVAVVAMLGGLTLLGARPRLAGGLLLATGITVSLHYAGLLVAAARAIGEVGDVRSAGYIGVLAGLLTLGAGAWVSRR